MSLDELYKCALGSIKSAEVIQALARLFLVRLLCFVPESFTVDAVGKQANPHSPLIYVDNTFSEKGYVSDSYAYIISIVHEKILYT